MCCRIRFLVCVVFLLSGTLLRSDTAAFDLSGPALSAKVTRAGKTLPISKVPSLQPGDRIWIHPELPAGEAVHYLMIPVFLRGSTNPPPDKWFTRVETWKKQVREEGVVITVPEGAEQALIFFAPETGGDFGTLRSAVRGKPGSFVRASQDLNQAALDRSRLDKYLNEVKQSSDTDAHALHDRSVLLARSLNIKLDNDCFQKPREQQESCLTQNTDQLVLDDGHSQSMVAALTSGSGADLIGAVSTTKLAGGGAYSPYVGAVVDLAKMMTSFRTPEYQYIPALGLASRERIDLKLNNPPSFRKPMSVMVASLPAVESAQLPPLRPVDPNQVLCLEKPSLVLPVEGAPVVFSTEYAHDVVLHLSDKAGHRVDLPARADASSGGFVLDAHTLVASNLDNQLNGMLRGKWGFDSFDGPAFHLQNSHRAQWTVAPAEQASLIVGREDSIHLHSDAAACIESVSAKDEKGKLLKPAWISLGPGEVEVKLALKDESPGKLRLAVKQYALEAPDEVAVNTYSEGASLEKLAIYAGDSRAVLTGTRLDEVATVELRGVHFVPDSLSRADAKDVLGLSAESKETSALHAGDEASALVTLKDGRTLNLQTAVSAARPKVVLLNKTIQPGPSAAVFHLGSEDELPQDGKLSFFLRSEVPETFSRTEKIEVATADSSSTVALTFADGSLVAQDAHTIMVTLDPAKSFGPSVFGSLRFRPVADGTEGDWQPLATLVRVPALKDVHCPANPDKQCTLSGSNLFLIDSVASDAQFEHSAPVPLGFADAALTVPRPNGTLLYVKLRDDPSVVNRAVLPVLPNQP
ncbi:MAG TPA: hypothetical protein VF011_16570 [Terriglobales bacterium]